MTCEHSKRTLTQRHTDVEKKQPKAKTETHWNGQTYRGTDRRGQRKTDEDIDKYRVTEDRLWERWIDTEKQKDRHTNIYGLTDRMTYRYSQRNGQITAMVVGFIRQMKLRSTCLNTKLYSGKKCRNSRTFTGLLEQHEPKKYITTRTILSVLCDKYFAATLWWY